MISRRALLAVFSTVLLLGLAWGCSAADNTGTPAISGGGSTGLGDSGNPELVVMPEAGPLDAGQLHLNPLCVDPSIDTSCLPDSPISCNPFKPPSQPKSPSADADAAADASGQADANGEGGSGGDHAGPIDPSHSGEAGASGAAGQAGAAGEGGAAGAPALTEPKYGCHVQRSTSAPNVSFSRCALAGPGGENAPCLTASDCQASLGCVGDQNAGLCLRYCCQDANDCESGTYCAERPMRDATTNALPKGAPNTSPLIPVCVHAENCDLSAPYPCPKGSECACQTGTACLVVRSDGTTTCAVPGNGKVGEACPCAWGHVCSAATNQCLKLCSTRDSSACGDGKCQSASELPAGWGVCVGVTPSGG